MSFMITDADRQHRLTNVHRIAQHLHAVRAYTAELLQLLEEAEHAAASSGAARSLIAQAADVTPGRMTQILARPSDQHRSPALIDERVEELLRDMPPAISRHEASFAGTVPQPPYPRPIPRS
ncbi:hypothetical protein [Microbacterium sp.]|uniref:hypothetical protein n=1 Tax=Microbacterium sp. TaxID=51671 RepID=UPI003F9D4EC6